MKTALFALLLIAIPSAAIADNLPENYMIWRGKVYNLNYLWGKGIAPTQQQASQPMATPQPTAQTTDSREVAANKQRVEFENARNQAAIEQLNRR
jgi:hypothetical protein